MAGCDDIKNYPPESLGDEKIMIPSLSVWNRCLLYVLSFFFYGYRDKYSEVFTCY